MPLTPAAVARLIEFTEGAAYADLLRAAPPEWHSEASETPGGVLLISPAVDLMLFNRLIGCGVEQAARAGDVQASIARLRAIGVRQYAVQLSPAAEPPALREWLSNDGLAVRDRWTKVYRDAAPAAAVSTDLRVTRVESPDADVFGDVVAAGFGMPPAFRPWLAATVGRPGWRQYLAWSGDEAVAGAALFLRGDVGWLGVAATRPHARRRGAQSALMARRIEDGRALGCRWFVTETGEDTPARPNPSFHNMTRAGFQVAYHRENYMPPPV